MNLPALSTEEDWSLCQVQAAIPSLVPSLTEMYEYLLCAGPVGVCGLGWAVGWRRPKQAWVLARLQEDGGQQL